MCVYVTNAVMDHFNGEGSLLMLAIALARCADTDGTSIFPSVDTLAKQTRRSRRMVQILLKELIGSGWLIRVSAGRGGRRREFCKMDGYRGNTTLYRINPDWIAKHVNPKQPLHYNGTDASSVVYSDSKKMGQVSVDKDQKPPALRLVKGATASVLGRNAKQDRVQQLLHTTDQSTDHKDYVVVDNHKARVGRGGFPRFAMYQDWEPSDGFVMRLTKLGVTKTLLTVVRLAEFVNYWESREHFKLNQKEWEHKLYQHLNKIQIRTDLKHGGGEDFYADMPASLTDTLNL